MLRENEDVADLCPNSVERCSAVMNVPVHIASQPLRKASNRAGTRACLSDLTGASAAPAAGYTRSIFGSANSSGGCGDSTVLSTLLHSKYRVRCSMLILRVAGILLVREQLHAF
jgi:hypothetical protein